MCTDSSMDPQMHPSKEPSATLFSDFGADHQSGFRSNDCPDPSAVSDFNLTFQLAPTLSQTPSPATDPNLGTGFDPKPLPTPVAKPTPKSLPTPVAKPTPKTLPTPLAKPTPKSFPLAVAYNSPNPLSVTVAEPSPKPLPTPVAKVTPRFLSTPVAEPTPKLLCTPIADNSPSPHPSPSPSSGVTPEPATPLPRLRSFDLFLDHSQNGSMVSNSPKLILNTSQPLARAEHQPVSNSWADHDLGTLPASAKPPPFTPPAGRSPIFIPHMPLLQTPKKGSTPTQSLMIARFLASFLTPVSTAGPELPLT